MDTPYGNPYSMSLPFKSGENEKPEKKMVKTERVKSQWENTYIEKGLREQKVEEKNIY